MNTKCQGITLRGEKCNRKCRISNYCHSHQNQNKTFQQPKPAECMVCYESLTNQRDALDCGHWVHTGCIVNSAKAECPLCRQLVRLGAKDMSKLRKLAKKRKLEILQDEENELRAGLQDHVAEIIGPILQERIQDALGYLLENNEDLETELIDEDMYQGFLYTLLNYDTPTDGPIDEATGDQDVVMV